MSILLEKGRVSYKILLFMSLLLPFTIIMQNPKLLLTKCVLFVFKLNCDKQDINRHQRLVNGFIFFWNLLRCMYFGGWEDDDDYYHPMRPLPSTWNCGVVVPSDLDVTSLDLKHLQGLSRSLEILTKIRKAKNEYAYRCGK